MDEYIFDKEIFKTKFLQGSELRNRAKSTCKNSDSICPVGSDDASQFSKVTENDLLIDLLHGILCEKIDSKKLALIETELSNEIEKQVKIKEDGLLDVFRNVVEDLYIDKSKKQEVTNLSLLRYRDSGKQKDLGKFIGEVLLFDETRDLFKTAVGDATNPMDDIVNKAYAGLKILQPDTREKEYACLFKNELESIFVHANSDIAASLNVYDGSITEITFLISYYMFIYLSQIALRFDKDLDNQKTDDQMFLYFKMGKESVSEDRECIAKGWKRVERKTKNLFAHFILLNMLNLHDNTTKFMTYSDLYEYYEAHENERKNMDDAISYLIQEYTVNHKYSSDTGNYVDFSEVIVPVGSDGDCSYYQEKIKYLFKCIEHQLLSNKNRTNVRRYISSNYEHLMKMRFVKSWGNQGKLTMISNDDLLLMIQICQRSSKGMNKELGIQINDLFEEFESRGLYFDGQSKKYIIDYLHQINLIDSKCDSEEAQYVKQIQ